MSKKDKYQEYLEQKHSSFGVEHATIEEAIMKATGSEYTDSERIIAGEVNEVHLVKTKIGDFIVRISHGDNDRFTPEKWAIDKSKEQGVPAPNVLLVEEMKDKGKNVMVCVEEKLDGDPLKDCKFSEDDLRSLTEDAGEILAKIHSVETSKYGRLKENGGGDYGSWEDYMLKPAKEPHLSGMKEAAERAGIGGAKIDEAAEILLEHRETYSEITPHLLHGDYGPKHILVSGKKITGILDFENAKSGDPVRDFAWWSYFGRSRPPLEWLKSGYERVSKLPEDFDLRVRLGRLRLGMDMLWYYESEGNEHGLEIAKSNLLDDLDYFKKV